MHEKSQEGINVILATLKDKIKKEDSKKEDALGFPENMNYGDRSMMRHELIRIVRVSYLLEYITVETLGRCYISNINQLFKMIELPESSLMEYENKMAPLKWVDPTKVEAKKDAPPAPPAALTNTNGTAKKFEPILKVVFHLNQQKLPQ